ncbi:hypothetical protein FQN54_000080 [Arachnomyces sp. PD_36]|nr:hypothetical protein FQN54_000080 [Arachnomyces sp. PD_36]
MEGITSTGASLEKRDETISSSTGSNQLQVPPVAAVDDDESDFYNTTANTPIEPKPSSTVNNSEPATPHPSVPMIPGLTLFNKGGDSGSAQTVDSGEVLGENIDMNRAVKPNESAKTDLDSSRTVSVDTEMEGTILSNAAGTEQKLDNRNEEETAVSVNAGDGVDHTKVDDAQAGASDIDGESNENNVEMGDHPEWEVDSSPYESSSTDTSSDSSSDDSDSDDDDYAMLGPEEQARILMLAEGGSDNEDGGKGRKGGGAQIKSTNERPEEIVPKPDVTVTPEMKIEFLGKVETAVENVALIRANTSGEYQVLEMGSVLCLENRDVIGVVSETLGQVQQPLYTVRFPSIAALEEAGLKAGTNVYYVIEHSTFVFTQPLKGLKGSDASNLHDEEAGEDEIEFSDDEAEAAYKRQLKQKKQERKEARSERGGYGKPRRGGDPRGPSNLSTMEINYDDEDQDGYTPLVRPKNLHEMMGQQEAPVEGHQAEARVERAGFRGGRGRGRGGFDRGRGRGNRGKRGGERYMHPQPSRGDYQQQSSSYDRTQGNPYPQLPPNPSQPAQSYNTQQYSNNQSYQPPQPQLPPPFPFNSSFPAPNTAPQQFSPPTAQFSPQQNSFFPPPGSHINPAFFPTMSQPQQPQQQQPSQPQNGNQADPFAAAQAQLDLLRRLSGYAAGGGGQQGGQGNSG